MLTRRSTMLVMLGAAVAVPFGANKLSTLSESGSGFGSGLSSFFSSDEEPAETSAGVTITGTGATVGVNPVAQGQGNAYHRIASVLRMDVNPDWVFQKWSRKSTKLANIDRFGVRVPFVSGTQADDIAGSLTYYFGMGNQVERISFHGRTGDPRALTHVVTRQYGLTPQPPIHPGEQLYQSLWNGRVKSELRLKLAPVLSAETSLNAFEVSLELERPDSNYFLDDERAAASLAAAEAEKPTGAAPDTAKEKKPEEPQKWIQGPPLHNSLYFNPQRTKPIVKPAAKKE